MARSGRRPGMGPGGRTAKLPKAAWGVGGARVRGVHRPWSIPASVRWESIRESPRKGTRAAATFPRRRGLGGGVIAHAAKGIRGFPTS